MKSIDLTRVNLPDFRKRLLNWYSENQRRLPWRETSNPYFIWVSEVMLQQTQVVKVLEYYRKFIKTFPDIRRLAAADLQDVLKVWEKMGYYARARNLHKAARMIVEELDGEIPSEYERFRKLPGVGEYIAAAVMSIAFNKSYAVADGNVKRVLSRIFLMEAPVNGSGSGKIYRERADFLLDKEHTGMFNQAMMELGATICKPQNPLCDQCPVSNYCAANRESRQQDFPLRKPARKIPEYHIAVGVVHKNGQILITRRKNEGLLGGLWEFPGGKVRPGETAGEACLREIREEVGLSVDIIDYLTEVKHAYTHFKIVMDVYRCKYLTGKVKLNGPQDYRWISLEEIERYPFPMANHKFIPRLLEIAENKLGQ